MPINQIASIFVKILDRSECVSQLKEKVYLLEIMENRISETLMLYRGSRDGWKKEDFHRKVDGKEKTISLFRIEEDDTCVGGFTDP